MHLYSHYLPSCFGFLGWKCIFIFRITTGEPRQHVQLDLAFPSQNLKFPNKCPMTGTNLQACKFSNRKLIRHTCFRSLSFLFLFALAAYHMPISFPDNPDGCLSLPRLLPLPFEKSALLRTPLKNVYKHDCQMTAQSRIREPLNCVSDKARAGSLEAKPELTNLKSYIIYHRYPCICYLEVLQFAMFY